MDYLEQLEAREAAGKLKSSTKQSTGCAYLDGLIAKEEKKDQDSGEKEISLELKPKGFDYGL